MQVLVFDIWGDYGFFRKFYTTSSPLTFSFPPPSTIAGMLGAIAGISKEEYLDVFSLKKCFMAIQIIKPVKKTRMGINFINTKANWRLFSKGNPRSRISVEFLKNPHYRIYFNHKNDKMFKNVSSFVQKHKSVYTVSMGLSELLANFKFIGMYDAVNITDSKKTEIATVLPLANITNVKNFRIEPNKKILREKIPTIMNNDRIIEKYSNIVYETSGKKISAEVRNYWELCNGENIVFF